MSDLSTKSKRMLDQADIEAAVLEVTRLAAASGVKVALAGGVALQRLGSTRFTADVDFIAAAAIQDLQPVKALSFGGYSSKTASNVPVDLIVRDDDYRELYEEALLYARIVDGVPMVSAEYLAAMKLVARRGKDRADLEFMIAERLFNVAKARRIIRRNLGAYAAEDFDSFVQVARWRNRST